MRTTTTSGHRSARLLQTTWRAMRDRTDRMLARFLDTGIESVSKSASFTDLVALIKSRSVIDSLKPCLERICFLSSVVHGAAVVRLQTHHRNFFTTRMFLVMYLVRYHPEKVFSAVGPIEISIMRVAGLLVDEFEEMSLIIKTSKSFFRVPADLCKRFCAHLGEYFRDFSEWEQADRTPVWTRMRASLVTLYFAFFAHKPVIREDILEQITRLRQRALDTDNGKHVLARFDADLRVGKFGLPPLDTQQLKTLVSDPRFFLLGGLDQLLLVQALLLDVNHQVTDKFLSDDPMHVHVTLTRDSGSSWNKALIGLISTTPAFNHVHDFFKEFKQRILVLASVDQQNRVHSLLDLGQPLQSLDQCLTVVGSIRECMRMVQMPIRDKETDAGWAAFTTIATPNELIDAVKYAHRVIKMAELDNHCIHILMASRVVHANGVSYIEKFYQESLENGSLTMGRTRAWVSGAVRESLTSYVTLAELRPLTTMSVVKVLYVGMDCLVFGSEVLNNEHDLPETFLLDVWRLCSLQRKFRVDLAAVCILSNLKALMFGRTPGESRLALERVAQIFTALEYGGRGVDDDVFAQRSSLMARIRSVLPAGVFYDSLDDCLDFKSLKLQCVTNLVSPLWKEVTRLNSLGVGDFWNFLPAESAFFIARIRKNLLALRSIFAINCKIHLQSRLRKMVEEEVAAAQQ